MVLLLAHGTSPCRIRGTKAWRNFGDHGESADSSSAHSADDLDIVDDDPFVKLEPLLKERWVVDDPESFAIFEDEELAPQICSILEKYIWLILIFGSFS